MTSTELDNLVRAGLLTREPPTPGEVEGLLSTGGKLLADATNESLSLSSRFSLAYAAAHALALAALRRRGYRSPNRYRVFQTAQHTLGISAATTRLLAKAHQERNREVYHGVSEVDERLATNLVAAAQALLTALRDDPMP